MNSFIKSLAIGLLEEYLVRFAPLILITPILFMMCENVKTLTPKSYEVIVTCTDQQSDRCNARLSAFRISDDDEVYSLSHLQTLPFQTSFSVTSRDRNWREVLSFKSKEYQDVTVEGALKYSRPSLLKFFDRGRTQSLVTLHEEMKSKLTRALIHYINDNKQTLFVEELNEERLKELSRALSQMSGESFTLTHLSFKESKRESKPRSTLDASSLKPLDRVGINTRATSGLQLNAFQVFNYVSVSVGLVLIALVVAAFAVLTES